MSRKTEPVLVAEGARVPDIVPARVATEWECPICFGKLVQMDGYRYCPTEDTHPGGVFCYGDGRIVRADRRLEVDM